MFRIDTMSLRGLGSVCAALLMGAACAWAQEQLPSAPQPQPSAGQPATSSSSSNTSSSKQTAEEQQQQSPDEPKTDEQKTDKKPPSKLKRVLNRAKPNCANIGGKESCWDKNPQEKEAEEQQKRDAEEAQSRMPKNQAPPRSEAPAGQSSSRDTQIDLTPPPDDMTHEGADMPSDVTEFHAYDPHKAAKNVEVGDFYFSRKNYRAAESRYAEALEWKPNDAIATFRLAQSQENLGKKDDAVKNYQGYLKILPAGEFAAEAKSSIERLKK